MHTHVYMHHMLAALCREAALVRAHDADWCPSAQHRCKKQRLWTHTAVSWCGADGQTHR